MDDRNSRNPKKSGHRSSDYLYGPAPDQRDGRDQRTADGPQPHPPQPQPHPHPQPHPELHPYPHAPAGYYGAYAVAAPFGVDVRGRPLSPKSKLAAGLLQLLVGYVGAGRWYTGHRAMALCQLLTLGGLGVWSMIDGIYLLAGSNASDSEGRILR